MKPIFWIGVLLLSVVFVAAAPPQRSERSAIEGVVLRAGTDEPVFRVLVRLVPTGPETSPTTNTVFVATTDNRGRFALTDLEAGEYRLLFAANGYVVQEYGQKVSRGEGTPLKLSAGQPLNNMVVRLTPTGTVSGRVLDRNGQPLGNVPVQLMRQTYQSRGAGYEKGFDQEHDTRTNDRGEYRLFFVTPGRYLLSAGEPPNRGVEYFNGPAGNPFREDVAYSYYPGVLDAASARTLNVRSGEELSGIDMVVNPPRTFSVRGRVIDGRTGAPPATVNLAIVTPSERTIQSRATYSASTGAFLFRDVPEGRYAAVAGTVVPPAFTGREEPSPSPQSAGFGSLNIDGADIDGVVLTLQAGISVAGRLRVDDSAGNSNTAGLRPFRIVFVPTGGMPSAANQMRLYSDKNVEAGGAFRLDGLWDIEYRLMVFKPEGWYVKQARLGDQDVLNRPLRLSTAPDVLDILVSPNTAEIQVTAVDQNLKPVPGAQVVLVPAGARDRSELFNFGSADTDGRVKLAGVVPGDYTLIAWEAVEELSWFDPDVLKDAEASAKPLRIAEGAKMTAEIRVIPAQ